MMNLMFKNMPDNPLVGALALVEVDKWRLSTLSIDNAFVH